MLGTCPGLQEETTVVVVHFETSLSGIGEGEVLASCEVDKPKKQTMLSRESTPPLGVLHNGHVTKRARACLVLFCVAS